jgi:Tfp pilus assembly protein PilN
MLEINLLPWREQQRSRQRKQVWLSSGIALVLLALIASVPRHFTAARPPTNTAVTTTAINHATVDVQQKLDQIKFVGFVRQGVRVWGLLLLANGETREVRMGANIPGMDARIVSINQQRIIVSSLDKRNYVLTMVH